MQGETLTGIVFIDNICNLCNAKVLILASSSGSTAKKGDRVAKKLLAYHKKKKREQKIKKLLAFDNHWSGLS